MIATIVAGDYQRDSRPGVCLLGRASGSPSGVLGFPRNVSVCAALNFVEPLIGGSLFLRVVKAMFDLPPNAVRPAICEFRPILFCDRSHATRIAKPPAVSHGRDALPHGHRTALILMRFLL
jgi:hypothetical protein